MRVAFVTVGDTGRLTGGYLYNARVLDGLRALGVEVDEVVAGGASPEEQRTASHREILADPTSFDVIVVDALARIAVAPHLDRWRSARPVVAMVHELPSVADSKDVAREREHEEPLLRADLLVAVSAHGRGVLETRGVPEEHLRVVPPGFDRLVFGRKVTDPVRDPVREPVGGPVRALCVAQWIPRKGILTLVRAWNRGRRPGAVLELVGETDADPGYGASVRAAIGEAPRGSVVVSGAVDDAALAEAYAGADLFVLPSRYEGYGMVFAEALAAGLPVVACDVGPVPDLVGPDAALLVPPDDADALSGALHRLEDPALRGRMSAAARRRALDLPRWEDTVAGFHGALVAAVSDAGREPGRARTPAVDLGDRRDLREQNRLSWNAVVGAHESHRGNLAALLRAGGTTLFPEERALLGDLEGDELLHLQCNSGGDSLSLAALGARVTGVDLSDGAIGRARGLSDETGIPARFERADLYDWLTATSRSHRRFDVVYSSYGVVCWLPDLGAWAGGIAEILKPGGRFVLVDFHPAAEMFDDRWNHARDYPSGGERLPLPEGVGDYVGASRGGLTPAGFEAGMADFENPEPAHLFRWGLGEVVTALAGAGLKISALEEYPYANGERHFARMRELPGRRMVPPEGVPNLPLTYGVRAEKAQS